MMARLLSVGALVALAWAAPLAPARRAIRHRDDVV